METYDASRGYEFYPGNGAYKRTEFPDNYQYPFPDISNREMFRQYSKLAQAMPGILICGRLGEYRYYDMDHAIDRARGLARKVLGS